VCVLAAVERDLIVLEYRPAQVRRVVEIVRRRWPSSARWSEDELVAAAAALLGLMEPIEHAGGLQHLPETAERRRDHDSETRREGACTPPTS
jgi:hypothetical protein